MATAPNTARARNSGAANTEGRRIPVMLDPEDLAIRRARFAERTDVYLRAGYDRRAAARFVAGAVDPACGPVLDVGTGKGLLAIALAERGLRVVSVDLDGDEQTLAALLAREAGVDRRIAFVRADASRLPCANLTFGAVVSLDVLHHLVDPEPVLREMVRSLRVGGQVILADFTEEGFALVSHVHRLEGGKHPRYGIRVDAAARQVAGWGFARSPDILGFFHDVAVLTRTSNQRVTAGPEDRQGD